jgi:hypothetical protein
LARQAERLTPADADGAPAIDFARMLAAKIGGFAPPPAYS